MTKPSLSGYDEGVFCVATDPPERSNIWKGARRILGCSDEAIHLVWEGASGKQYWTVLGTTLSFDPRRKSHSVRCLKEGCGLRGDCPHIRRLGRYLAERAA